MSKIGLDGWSPTSGRVRGPAALDTKEETSECNVGQDLRYIAGDSEIERRITLADWKLIDELQKHLPDETETVFMVPDLGEDVVESVENLREAAAKLTEFIDNHADVLPYTYAYRCERIPGYPGVAVGYSSGGLSGIRLPGDADHFYFLRAGLDECSLERWGVSADGKGFPIDRQDLRQQEQKPPSAGAHRNLWRAGTAATKNDQFLGIG